MTQLHQQYHDVTGNAPSRRPRSRYQRRRRHPRERKPRRRLRPDLGCPSPVRGSRTTGSGLRNKGPPTRAECISTRSARQGAVPSAQQEVLAVSSGSAAVTRSRGQSQPHTRVDGTEVQRAIRGKSDALVAPVTGAEQLPEAWATWSVASAPDAVSPGRACISATHRRHRNSYWTCLSLRSSVPLVQRAP